MELVTVYPAVPPKAGGYSSPGSILVTYEVPDDEAFVRGYFSFTLRTVLGSDGKVYSGTMDQAIAMAQDMLRSHLIGEIVISNECLWKDPADQRPADEQHRSAPPPQQGKSVGDERALPPTTTPDGKPIKTFTSAKVEKERDPKSKKTYIGFYMANHQFPDTKVNSDATDMWARVCEQLKKLTGVDWLAADLGTVVTREMIVGYTDAKNNDKNGNPYKDFYGVKAK